MRIYVAGPISGIANDNREAFEAASKILRADGYEVILPTNLCPHETPRAVAMKLCIQALLTCDAIYFLDGWEYSGGALLEADIAYQCGIIRHG